MGELIDFVVAHWPIVSGLGAAIAAVTSALWGLYTWISNRRNAKEKEEKDRGHEREIQQMKDSAAIELEKIKVNLAAREKELSFFKNKLRDQSSSIITIADDIKNHLNYIDMRHDWGYEPFNKFEQRVVAFCSALNLYRQNIVLAAKIDESFNEKELLVDDVVRTTTQIAVAYRNSVKDGGASAQEFFSILNEGLMVHLLAHLDPAPNKPASTVFIQSGNGLDVADNPGRRLFEKRSYFNDLDQLCKLVGACSASLSIAKIDI